MKMYDFTNFPIQYTLGIWWWTPFLELAAENWKFVFIDFRSNLAWRMCKFYADSKSEVVFDLHRFKVTHAPKNRLQNVKVRLNNFLPPPICPEHIVVGKWVKPYIFINKFPIQVSKSRWLISEINFLEKNFIKNIVNICLKHPVHCYLHSDSGRTFVRLSVRPAPIYFL